MAAGTVRFFKCPTNLVLLRCSIAHQFSTCRVLSTEDKAPVKFSTSLAAKVSIGETTGLTREDPDYGIKLKIILGSLSAFLLYFCIIREENDLDEMLSLNSKKTSEEHELIDLKIKLAYCEKANLPTYNIKARIQEIVDKNSKPAFSR